MTVRRRFTTSLIIASAIAALGLAASTPALHARRADLPTRLSDQDFWALSQELSEPGGQFQSDNLLSNETGFQVVIPELTERLGTGGVYLGVGPEQNFTYIAALKPRVAFILDIRRGNRDLHLMYKALFEMAADRAEFLSLLFARPKPADLPKDIGPAALFEAFEAVAPVEADYQRTLGRIKDLLVKTHRLPLTDEELQGIDYVYNNFYRFGPGIGYTSSRSGRGGVGATYTTLMRATDKAGVARSYLANEEHFNVMKTLEASNLLVPVVGNFSGPRALRAIGAWLRERNATVSAYYLSNVEDYLSRDGSWPVFCQNATALPQTDKSTFIRSGGGYRQINGPATLTGGGVAISADQLRTLVAQGISSVSAAGQGTSTVTTVDGRTVTFSVAGGMAGGNRLGLFPNDLLPCALPKLPFTPFH